MTLPGPMPGALHDGLENLTLNQEIEFITYNRVVLPVDGWVFWSPGTSRTIKGSLHLVQEMVQNEDETFGSSMATFTAQEQITTFAQNPMSQIFVATADDGTRFAFSQQRVFKQAGLWHYFGMSISPAMGASLLDRNWSIDPERAVASNSLPLWLGLNGFASDFWGGFSNKGVPFRVKPPVLYPSEIVRANEVPPYGSVKILDDYPQALQSVPFLDVERNHWQLVTDRVRITLYGLQSDEVLDFLDTVNQYSLVTDNFGIMNMPVPRDVTRTQPELQTRAMKKEIVFDISYYQRRVAEFARKLIKKAPYTLTISDDALE